MRRGLVIGAVGTACALLLSGAACQPPPATPLCGNGRGGQPNPLMSADHDHVAYQSDSLTPGPDENTTACDVFVRTLSTGEVDRVSSEANAVDRPTAISADGRLVLFTVLGGGAKLVDRVTDEVLWARIEPRRDQVDMTTDGRFVVWVDQYHGVTVHRLDRTTGEETQMDAGGSEPGAGGEPIIAVSISDDGATVAIGAQYGLYVWDVDSRAVDRLSGGVTLRAELSPDGSKVARATDLPVDPDDGKVAIVDLATREETVIETAWDLGSMAWSLDGAWLQFGSSDQTLAGDLTGLDPRDLGALSEYGYRLRDHKIVRFFRPGFSGWPNGPTMNLVYSATERNVTNSPQDRRFEVVALEP